MCGASGKSYRFWMNYWVWLFFLGIPALVHGLGPESGRSLRVGRLMLAILLGYVFANVALYWERTLEWRALDECVAETGFWPESTEAFQACGHHVNIADGAAIVFYLYLGWIPAAGYTGFHELISSGGGAIGLPFAGWGVRSRAGSRATS